MVTLFLFPALLLMISLTVLQFALAILTVSLFILNCFQRFYEKLATEPFFTTHFVLPYLANFAHFGGKSTTVPFETVSRYIMGIRPTRGKERLEKPGVAEGT